MITILAAVLLSSTIGVCGNESGDVDARVAAIDALARAHRAKEPRESAKKKARIADGVVLVEADELNAPFGHAFDLHGKTLRFVRVDSSTFETSVEPLDIDPDLGTPLDVQPLGTGYAPLRLPFALPFFDRETADVYVTVNNSITLDAPVATSSLQIGDLELASLRRATIAPMLTTRTLQFGEWPQVFVKSAPDAVRITWKRDGFWKYTVQATLRPDGEIRFAYDVAEAPWANSVVLTAGHPLHAHEPLGEGSDETGDAEKPMFDITAASVSRVDRTNLLRFRIELAGAPQLAPAESVAYSVSVGEPALTARFFGDGRSFLTVPGWGIVLNHPAARINGRTIEIDVLQEHLVIKKLKETLTVTSSGDTATFEVSIDKPHDSIAQRFASMKKSESLRGPIFEAFTLPVVNVQEVWRQVGDVAPDADAVAIYQNFVNDITLYASAYSTVGNAGVDGIMMRTGVGSHLPKAPALMHMNALSNGNNSDPQRAVHNVMHELGHRWLYDFRILENGVASRVLNPVSAHPAQYVHTPAAFRVTSPTDSSVMGGGYFTQNADGSFSTWRTRQHFGYSWTDLYLMGLASPSEVPPWFYIANSVPRLGNEYYPLANRTYRGTRRNVSIEQLLQAMGPRTPAYPDTQREFQVLYVLLVNGEATAEELQQIRSMRESFARDFATATGGRGAIR